MISMRSVSFHWEARSHDILSSDRHREAAACNFLQQTATPLTVGIDNLFLCDVEYGVGDYHVVYRRAL